MRLSVLSCVSLHTHIYTQFSPDAHKAHVWKMNMNTDFQIHVHAVLAHCAQRDMHTHIQTVQYSCVHVHAAFMIHMCPCAQRYTMHVYIVLTHSPVFTHMQHDVHKCNAGTIQRKHAHSAHMYAHIVPMHTHAHSMHTCMLTHAHARTRSRL